MTNTAIDNNSKNTFGQTLGDLFASTKKSMTKKDWSILLNVSESAISQWINGKTFPDPDRLRMIISIYSKIDLKKEEQEKFNQFKACLELSLSRLWHKSPSKTFGQNGSDYALTEFESDIKNSISILFYDLKSELYNQILRHVEIIKSDLIEKLIDTPSRHESNSFNEQHLVFMQLQGSFQKSTNISILSQYAKQVEEIHHSLNENFAARLQSIKIEFDKQGKNKTINDKGYKFDSCCIADRSNYIKEDLKIQFHKKYILLDACNSVTTANKKFSWTFENLREISPIANECLNFKYKAKGDYEIAFTNPAKNHEELLNIGISRLFLKKSKTPEITKSSLSYYFDLKDHSRINENTFIKINHQDELNSLQTNFNSESYAMKLSGRILSTLIRSVFNTQTLDLNLIDWPNEHKSKFIIPPGYTKENYSVEFLNLGSEPTTFKSSHGNGILILLLGKICIIPEGANDDTFKCEINSDINNPQFIPLGDDYNWNLKSIADDESIVLLLKECK